jgi:hypothetical protein
VNPLSAAPAGKAQSVSAGSIAAACKSERLEIIIMRRLPVQSERSYQGRVMFLRQGRGSQSRAQESLNFLKTHVRLSRLKLSGIPNKLILKRIETWETSIRAEAKQVPKRFACSLWPASAFPPLRKQVTNPPRPLRQALLLRLRRVRCPGLLMPWPAKKS